jgi:hypothetical protein
MQTIRSAAAASVGARVLGEIEETTLDEVRGWLAGGEDLTIGDGRVSRLDG